MDLKKDYEILGKKYDLPKYEELDDEFELLYFQNIIEIKYPLRFVRRRIIDKFGGLVSFFQNILNPGSGSLIAMEESGFLSKEEKDELITLVKKMVTLERESLLLDINHDDGKDAEFIKKAYFRWKEFKVNIEKHTRKLRDGWKKETKEESDEHYFG